MANLTRLQSRDYVRSKLSELDSQKVTDLMLNVDCNFALRKVQRDLMALGIKQFTKTSYLTSSGSVTAVPTDLLSIPNSIIDMKASTGTKNSFSTNIGTTNADITVTSREPGSVSNATPIYFSVSCTGGATLAVTVTVGATILIDVVANGTSHTGSNIIALINADSIASQYIVASTKTGSTGAGVFDRSAASTQLTGGTGTAWYPAKELSIEDFNRVSNNTYQVPSATDPAYCKMGGASGEQLIYFLPVTVTYMKIHHYYQLADFSADTTTNPLPAEYEELFLMDLLRKTYETLSRMAESQNKAVEYESKVKDLEAKYMTMLGVAAGDKQRLQSNDQNK